MVYELGIRSKIYPQMGVGEIPKGIVVISYVKGFNLIHKNGIFSEEINDQDLLEI